MVYHPSVAASQSHETVVRPANRLNLDYAAEAARFEHPGPIVDIHTHINGGEAAKLYQRACELYGIERTYSMTPLEGVDAVRRVLGESIQFIAVPNYRGDNGLHEHGAGFIDTVKTFHDLGSRIVKFWAAPRAVDYGKELGDPDLLRLDNRYRREVMDLAGELGMMFMAHVADPDTWFATKYADASVYGTKAQQYEPFEMLLDKYTNPWIAAHMGGWPEDLEFLSGLLERHDNLYLDTSAAKWMIRELSKHSRAEFIAFMTRFKGRILFGSDIVTSDEHLESGDKEREILARAGSSDEAFDLYASRYWALRTLLEGDYDGPSPIADPDLALVDPDQYDETDAPTLAGKSLPADLLGSIYQDAAAALLNLG